MEYLCCVTGNHVDQSDISKLAELTHAKKNLPLFIKAAIIKVINNYMKSSEDYLLHNLYVLCF